MTKLSILHPSYAARLRSLASSKLKLVRSLILFSTIVLTACGGGGSSDGGTGDTTDVVPTNDSGDNSNNDNTNICDKTTQDINWEALLNEDCPTLKDYGLFTDPLDPTQSPTPSGQPFNLNTQLFSDYANKYRFVFVPPGKQVQYHATEVFNFPVGTALVKTFALPQNLDDNSRADDQLIETRLLINREPGWTTLVYRWQNGSARLELGGANVEHTIISEGNAYDFTYHIPSRAECKNCHQFKTDNGNRIIPIGPKARLLNNAHQFPSNPSTSQLGQWQALGLLIDTPEDLLTQPSAKALQDETASLEDRAKGYIDVNCAHCHRAEGFASISGLRLSFFVDHTKASYGICKQPPGYDGGAAGLNFDIIPGNGIDSIIPYRMEHTEAKDRMPPIGRSLVHDEAVALVRRWIDSMEPLANGCQ